MRCEALVPHGWCPSRSTGMARAGCVARIARSEERGPRIANGVRQHTVSGGEAPRSRSRARDEDRSGRRARIERVIRGFRASEIRDKRSADSRRPRGPQEAGEVRGILRRVKPHHSVSCEQDARFHQYEQDARFHWCTRRRPVFTRMKLDFRRHRLRAVRSTSPRIASVGRDQLSNRS